MSDSTLGKVRIEASGGLWAYAKVTVDGVALPVTRLRILPVGPGDAETLIKAEIEVLVDSIDLPEVKAAITKASLDRFGEVIRTVRLDP